MSYWSRSFPGLPEHLGEVRRFTQMVLGDAPGTELVVMAVSELAGNAIVHTASGAPDGQFVVHLATFADRWKVRVDDEGSPSEPHVVVDAIEEDPESDSESGRGLAMVASISGKWGVIGGRCARAVWAEIPYPVAVGGGVESVMSGGMLEALAAVAQALDDEDGATYQEVDSQGPPPALSPTPAPIPAPAPAPAPARWPGTVRCDPALAERMRAQASRAAFQRALIENAYAETIGPRPLPFWPPFPNPLALQGATPGGDTR
jgi:serine/threonine-protein kinase RsbW